MSFPRGLVTCGTIAEFNTAIARRGNRSQRHTEILSRKCLSTITRKENVHKVMLRAVPSLQTATCRKGTLGVATFELWSHLWRPASSIQQYLQCHGVVILVIAARGNFQCAGPCFSFSTILSMTLLELPVKHIKAPWAAEVRAAG